MLIVSLLVASFVIFGAIYLAPGNPLAALSGGRTIPPDSLRILEARYHLDQPFLFQPHQRIANRRGTDPELSGQRRTRQWRSRRQFQ